MHHDRIADVGDRDAEGLEDAARRAAASSRLVICVLPCASAPNISIRCEIDLSPGIPGAPDKRCAGLTVTAVKSSRSVDSGASFDSCAAVIFIGARPRSQTS